MATFEVSTVIYRTIEEVFAFLSNPENSPKWSSGSSDVTMTSAGPIGVGSTYRTVRTVLGRRIESEGEFTAYEPNHRYATKSLSGPFPLEGQVTFERVDSGTKVRATLVGEPGGFFKLAESLLMSTVKRQFEADLANLKDLMESHAL
jgi:uncharacterized membrane protein